MATNEKIVPLNIGCWADVGVSGAKVLQTEYSTFLLFNATSDEHEDLGTALIEFPVCLITKFGYPNDEAWFAIPRTRGLSYGAFEVLNSAWIGEIAELNRHAFPNLPYKKDRRHFLFLFHDSSFECVAHGLNVEIISKPCSEVAEQITKRILSSE